MSARKLAKPNVRSEETLPPKPLPTYYDPYTSPSFDLSDIPHKERAVQVAMLVLMPSVSPARPEYVLGVVEARPTRRGAT